MVKAPYSAKQYRKAFEVLGARVSEGQRRMLMAHASAPQFQLTDEQLAAGAGRSVQYTWGQYGRLAHAIADVLGYQEPEYIWTRVIADDSREPITGRVRWQLYREVAAALEAMGWHNGLTSPDPLTDAFSTSASLEGVPETVRQALVEARLRQGAFRDKLVSFWGGCSVTSCSLLEVVRASHIKPWRHSTNEERLDVYNGLLLVANVDALFDAGLVTFEDSGQMICSARLGVSERRRLGLRPNLKLRRVDALHRPYLKWHRDSEFER